jgi:hypothetical protein
MNRKPPFAVLAVKPGCRFEQAAWDRPEAGRIAARLAASGWTVKVLENDCAGENPA